MESEKGQSRLPLLLMVGGGIFLVLAVIWALTGGDDDNSAAEDLALQARCASPACRAADNELPARGYEGQSVVADPDDPNHIVVTDANMIAGACSFHVTFDRGKEWEDGIFALPDGYTGCRINGPSGGHVPMGNAVRGPSGNLYVTLGSAHSADSRRESVIVGVSSDGGRSWQMQAAARPPDLSVGYGRPLISAFAGPSGQDSVFVTFWECTMGGGLCPNARFIRSDDNGRTFTPPVYINDPIGGQNPSQAALTADGTVHVIYQLRYSDGVTDLVGAASYDGGATFEKNLIDTQFAIGGTRGYDPAKLVVNPLTDELYTAYADARTARQAIIFRKSADGGATWAAPVGVSPDQGATPTRTPWLSVAPDGRIDIAFYRTPAEKSDDVFWAFSHDGGATFTVRQVTDSSIDRSFGYVNEIGNWYPPGVDSLTDAAVVAWSDTENADDLNQTVDIYVRRMVANTFDLGLPP